MRVNQEHDPDVTGGAEGPAARSVDSFLEAKLGHPPVRDNWVSRARLLDQLDLATERPITLIAAPAGYGKTTLVAQWLARPRQRTRRRGSRWTPATTTPAGCGRTSPPRSSGSAASSGRQGPGSVGNVMTSEYCPGSSMPWPRCPRTSSILLDDFHLVHEPACHSQVEFLAGESSAAGAPRDHHACRSRASARSDQGVGQLAEIRATISASMPARSISLLAARGCAAVERCRVAAGAAHRGVAGRHLPGLPVDVGEGRSGRVRPGVQWRQPLHRRLPHRGGAEPPHRPESREFIRTMATPRPILRSPV